MKKILSLLLAFSMLSGIGASAKNYVRNVEHKSLAIEERKLHSGKRTVIEVTNGMVVAQTYTIPEGYALQEFEAFCPSFENNVGSLTFKIYQWQGDYAKTISSKPVTTRTFTDFKDNSYLPIPCSTPVTGTVMITASDSVEKVGIWTSNTRNDKANTVYIDGVPQGDTAFEATARVYPIKGDIPETAQKKDAYTSFHLGNSDVLYNAQPLDFKVDDITYHGFTAKNNNAVGIGKVDFGSASPKGVKLLVRATHVNSDSGQMQLVLDSYATGKIIAEFNLEYRSPEHYTIEIPCEITEKITGVHDLYLTTVGSGYVPLAIEFTKEHPGKSWDEIRLEDFKATNNFELLDHHSDTWVATDMLGRKLPDISTAGKYNPDKQVGIFYLTWHAQLSRYDGYDTISNNQRVLDTYNGDPAEIINDFNYPGWGLLGYWNESVYGYYLGVDTWVHRKQLELLGAAGMDTLICDATNASQTYTGGYMALCKTMHEMHNDGIKTPKMCFILPFSDTANVVADIERVYDNMYSTGLYSDCWYYWEDKPLIMSHYGLWESDTGNDEINKRRKEVKDFFTWRLPKADYFTPATNDEQWPWLEVYPQHPFGKSEKYGCEFVAVGIAQNANAERGLTAFNGENIFGRSYTYKDKHAKLSENSKLYGYNFQEQWDRAFELDPEFVFISEWNEWTAGHYEEWGGVKGAYPDMFSDEYSRDAEPSKGDLKDAYYLQMAANIRKFKGVRETPEASESKTIDLSGDFSQWAEVGPEFLGYKGGTEHRNERGAGVKGTVNYLTNTTGRNDIVLSKVARDSENLYFYVETAKDITPYTDPYWMMLYINSDRTYQTGWEGYDFIVNRVSPTENKAVIEKSLGGWNWEKAGEVSYKLQGNKMMVAIPRSILGVNGTVDIEFKWGDNNFSDDRHLYVGDIMNFYTEGDVAPPSRFNYHYVEDVKKAKKLTDEPVLPKKNPRDLLKYSTVMKIGSPVAFKENEPVQIDPANAEVYPKIVNDKTLVPLRFVVENLGATVEWDEATATAKIIAANKRIFVTVGSNIMRVEKEKRTLQTAAIEENGRILVPLRDIVEAAGEICVWVEPGYIVIGGNQTQLTTSAEILPQLDFMYK